MPAANQKYVLKYKQTSISHILVHLMEHKPKMRGPNDIYVLTETVQFVHKACCLVHSFVHVQYVFYICGQCYSSSLFPAPSQLCPTGRC